MTRATALAVAASAAAGATVAAPPPPLLVWNASASMPVGLYFVMPRRPVRVGDIVTARLTGPVAPLASLRGYLPLGVPLVKTVAAVQGDQVCALGDWIFINGAAAAVRHRQDRAGRSLPAWQGCIRLTHGQFFLLATHSPSSFDSRYFGPIEQVQLVGTAKLLWAS